MHNVLLHGNCKICREHTMQTELQKKEKAIRLMTGDGKPTAVEKKAPETKEMAPKIASPINLADSPLHPLISIHLDCELWCGTLQFGLVSVLYWNSDGFFFCATILCTLDASRTAPHKKAQNMNILLRCLQFQIARHDAVSLARCGGMQILQRPYGCLCSMGLPWP